MSGSLPKNRIGRKAPMYVSFPTHVNDIKVERTKDKEEDNG